MIRYGNNIYLGLDADVKPTNVAVNSIFVETDTGDISQYNGSSWILIVGAGKADSLTNKTLVNPVITNSGATITLPTTTQTLVGRTTTDTLTNKTLAAGSNTITGIVDANIDAHTSTKITITDKTHLPSDIAYDSSTNTLTNKSINLTNNTVTDTSTAAGDIPKSNGTKFVRLARGSANTILRVNSGGTDIEYGALPSAALPTHASTHKLGGSDLIKIDDLDPADDNTDLNASTSTHGLLPKLGGGITNFLRADGTWAEPPGGGGGGGAPTSAQYITLATDGTLTNERVLTAGTGISVTDAGAGSTATIAITSAVATLTGSQTLTNKTLTIPVISSISNSGTITIPSGTDTLVGRATTDTLTNKTLTSPTLTTPVISTISNSGTVTLPTGTRTLVARDTTDTLTNKTMTAPNINDPFITVSSNAITLPSTADTLVGRATTDTLTNKTLTAPVISTISNSGTITLPTGTRTLVARDTTDTLTNKTLTTPIISTISNTGTITLPTSTDTLVGRATTDTLTNKTITGLKAARATKTGAYTLTATDDIILGDATSASFSLTLPAAASNDGRIYHIQKIDSTANTVTIDPNASETINGASTLVLTAQYQGFTIWCNGAAWFTHPNTSERTGTASGAANGSATVFNIAHGLASTPYSSFVMISSVLGSTINYSWTADATNLVVTFASAPSAGSVVFQWRAVL